MFVGILLPNSWHLLRYARHLTRHCQIVIEEDFDPPKAGDGWQ